MKLLFVGGGNMASAIIGGLLASPDNGIRAEQICVVEPLEAQRSKLAAVFGVASVATLAQASAADVVIWAVKPQQFLDAAKDAQTKLLGALQISVMAGLRADAIASASGAARVVRTMPNTPALIGMGITGLHASAACSEQDRKLAAQILRTTSGLVWVSQEDELDAVTALSGSGPAYVFYVVEAMTQAGVEMGLSAATAKQLALATCTGAAELARRASEPPAVLRERVTSKGGTTAAALAVLEERKVKEAFIAALKAAQARAKQLGDELGR
jgi:pyrroline-5-carboxylate reductase